jgi:Tfp pilus assembly protein PilP
MEPAPVPDPTAGNLAAELEGPSIPEDADADTIERFMKLEKWHKEVLSSYAVDVSRMDDPFMPIETVARPPETDTSRQASRNLPMIQRLALNQFTLEAIIESPIPGSTTALVVSGGVGYILHEGTKIGPNNGTVRQITSSKVIIEEPEVNYRGERTSRITEFSLNPLEGIEDILG